MKPVDQRYASNIIPNARLIFLILAGGLLGLFVNNVESVETPSRVTRHQVVISGFAFIPKQLSLRAGDTITWINKDIVAHNIFDSRYQKALSPDLKVGETVTVIVEESLQYKCEFHPSMQGEISLIDSP